ncbi:unnamed protein product [Gongylonema pulchrum]|uniref:DUF5641 domain-containing protein n=1 Tax=Gongylonema pulchrum TaxID=637853 RepID=A0A183EFT9_9BILA|nr:unnamed protein product [Gongylonema pulchrum]
MQSSKFCRQTDTTTYRCVLHWIESAKTNPERFVENCLIEIRKSSAVFHYVQSSHNPADIATRWILQHDLKNEQLWWTGPTWLAKEKAEWPQWPPSRRTELHELETKILSIQDKEVNLGIHREVVEIKKYPIHELFDVNRCGSWYKYLHAIIYVLRFIKLTSSNKVGSTKQVSSSGFIAPEGYKITEKIAFCEWQKTSTSNKFWQLWQSGYLSLLRDRTQRRHRRPRSLNQPRGVWKIEKIVKLYLGHGNVIRTASARMPSGHILTRPISYLPPLEITREMQVPAVTDPNTEEAVESIS